MRAGLIETRSGRCINPDRPLPEDFSIRDIAHALSNICRFGGHCRTFYSVAQHSVLVSRLCPERLALEGLLHDAAEAYLGDAVHPVKYRLADYRKMETRFEEAIRETFGLPPEKSAWIKSYDNIVLLTEARDLGFNWTDRTHWPEAPPMGARIRPWNPRRARFEFLRRYFVLKGYSAAFVRAAFSG